MKKDKPLAQAKKLQNNYAKHLATYFMWLTGQRGDFHHEESGKSSFGYDLKGDFIPIDEAFYVHLLQSENRKDELRLEKVRPQDRVNREILFEIVKKLIQLKEGGTWDKENEIFDNVYEIKEYTNNLDTIPYSAFKNYQSFSNDITERLEAKARLLVDHLKSEPYQNALLRLWKKGKRSNWHRVRYVELKVQHLDGLQFTSCGRDFLSLALNDEKYFYLTPLPELEDESLLFDYNMKVDRRAAKLFAYLFINFLPATLDRYYAQRPLYAGGTNKLKELLYAFTRKITINHRSPAADLDLYTLEGIDSFKQFADSERRTFDSQKNPLNVLGYSLVWVTEILYLFPVIKQLHDEPGKVVNQLALIRQLWNISNATNSFFNAWLFRKNTLLLSHALSAGNLFFAMYDLVDNSLGLISALELDQTALAIGKGLKTGGAATTSLSIAAAVGGFTGIGVIILGLVGSALYLGGEVLITTFPTENIPVWTQLNYFGRNWKNIAIGSGTDPFEPGHLVYRWRTSERDIHLQRQVIDFFSNFFPLYMGASVYGTKHDLSVKIMPTIPLLDSTIIVKVIKSPTETRTIFQCPFNRAFTTVDHAISISVTPKELENGEQVNFWSGVFSSEVFSDIQSFKDQWIEVDIVLSDYSKIFGLLGGIAETMKAIFENADQSYSGNDRYTHPFVLRGRAKALLH